MSRIAWIGWRASRPLVWVAVGGCCVECDEGVSRHGAFLSVYDESLWGPFCSGLGDADHGGDEAELFVHDGTGHAAEELGNVLVVVPLTGGPALEDFIKIGLKMALSSDVYSK